MTTPRIRVGIRDLREREPRDSRQSDQHDQAHAGTGCGPAEAISVNSDNGLLVIFPAFGVDGLCDRAKGARHGILPVGLPDPDDISAVGSAWRTALTKAQLITVIRLTTHDGQEP